MYVIWWIHGIQMVKIRIVYILTKVRGGYIRYNIGASYTYEVAKCVITSKYQMVTCVITQSKVAKVVVIDQLSAPSINLTFNLNTTPIIITIRFTNIFKIRVCE